jgi:Tfp pilus assembly protein PilO
MTFADRIRNLSYAQAFLFGCLLTVGYYFVGYNDGSVLKNQISKKSTEIAELKVKIIDENKKIEQIAEFKKVAKEMGQDFETFVTYIPAKFNAYDLKNTISKEAITAGLNLSNITEAGSGQPEKGSFYESLKIKADLVGNFQQLMLFLSFLTRSERILTVQNISLSKASSAGVLKPSDPINLHLVADIYGYRYMQEAKANEKEQKRP